MDVILVVATILGGIAAIWFFWEKLQAKEPSWVKEVKSLIAGNASKGNISILQQTNTKNFLLVKTEQAAASPVSGRSRVVAIFAVPPTTLENGYNVSSLVDHGPGDVSVVFGFDFADPYYLVRIAGDENIQYKITEKTRGHLRIKFDEAGLKRVQVECEEAA
jgi:hypothetical protein